MGMFGGQSTGRLLGNTCRVKRIQNRFSFGKCLQSLLKRLAASALVFARERMAAKRKIVPAKREVSFVLPLANVF